MIKPALGVIRRTNWSVVGGPLLTAATAAVLGFLSTRGFRPENSASLVVLIVAFSVFAAITHANVIMVGVLHRRSTEQIVNQLRQSEQRFQAFMDNSPAVAWIKDDQGRYVFLNTPFELTFNVRRADLTGNTGPEPWSPETAKQLHENDRAVLET